MECFWIAHSNARTIRVLPDGCADIIYTREEGRGTLRFVGPMTTYVDFAQPSRTASVGIRFRPGMWGQAARMGGCLATDRVLLLGDLWGKEASLLQRRLETTDSHAIQTRLLSDSLPRFCDPSPIQLAIQALEQAHGQLCLLELANRANLSTRQFRRLCLEAAALPPKLLARILRFRHAQNSATNSLSGADLAFQSGYYDQSHLIAEFRAFSGQTPESYRNP